MLIMKADQLPLTGIGETTPKRKAVTAGLAVTQNGVEVTANKAKDGIEIRFECPPDAAMVARLEGAGFRLSRSAGCWYSLTCDQAKVFAYSLSV
jgi:hypothetical protein